MSRFITRWVISAVALYAAVAILPGIELQNENWLSIIWLALIFGLVNALVRPLLHMLTCPLIVLTLGLFVLVANTLLFALTGWLGTQFQVGFTLADPWFWNAFLGSLIVSVVSFILNLVLKDEVKGK
ncbi:MAG TPA: phage holin family protein [Anaerolineales bacterium]|nr:phage holin family protein [Anaerolineales bacterium]